MVQRRIVRLPEAERITGYKRPSIYRLEREEKFPARVKLGQGRGGAVGWWEDEILAWLEARIRPALSQGAAQSAPPPDCSAACHPGSNTRPRP